MKKKTLDVLVVEDDTIDYKAVERALARYRDPAFSLHRAETMEKGKQMLDDRDFDAVLLDLGLPDVHGMDSLVHFHANAPGTPIVVLTGQGDAHTADNAMDHGAEDFLLKSELYPDRLEEKLRLAMGRRRAHQEMLDNAKAYEEEPRSERRPQRHGWVD
jgi:two-component system cell cycle response regulator